jgi:ABC-type multidrug transport system fused ATPase/permease subunit
VSPGYVSLGHDGWRPGAVYWLAALTLLLVGHPLAARATRLNATVAGVASISFLVWNFLVWGFPIWGFLVWADLALAAVVAVPLVSGALANRRAAAARAAGMPAVGVMLDRVSAGTVQLISDGRSEKVRQDHLVAVDRLHDVFNAQTRRVSTAVVLAEIALSPVTILAVVLSAATVLVTPGVDVLAFPLIGPIIGGCVATLTRHQPTGAPPQFTTDTQANIRTTIGQLCSAVAPGRDVRKAAIAAIVTALLHGVSLALAITVMWSLLNQPRSPWLPLFSLLAMAIAHTLALRWSNGSAQAAGVAVLRQLSHRIIDRILIAPEGSLAEYKDHLPRLATRDAVTISGLPVHALRSFVSAGLTPVAAILTMIMIEWRLAIPGLLLLPLVSLAAFLLLRESFHDLRSALAATDRILTFLAR